MVRDRQRRRLLLPPPSAYYSAAAAAAAVAARRRGVGRGRGDRGIATVVSAGDEGRILARGGRRRRSSEETVDRFEGGVKGVSAVVPAAGRIVVGTFRRLLRGRWRHDSIIFVERENDVSY